MKTEDDILSSVIEAIEILELVLDGANDIFKNADKRHSDSENLINDIYHYIELEDVKKGEPMKLYSELSSVLKSRREAKDLTELRNWFSQNGFNKKFLNTLKSKFVDRKKSRANRQYRYKSKLKQLLKP